MELTQARLKELLNYDPETGIFTRVKSTNRVKVGSVAGCLAKTGYIRITLDYKAHRAHRLAYLFMNGEFPGNGLQIDHIDHKKDNNQWSNLRIVTQQVNNRNRTIGKNNKSGTVGVRWHKRDKIWSAQISINRKIKHLGSFKDINEAIAARKTAEKKYGFHPNHGK